VGWVKRSADPTRKIVPVLDLPPAFAGVESNLRGGLGEERAIGLRDPLAQADAGAPAERPQLPPVEQLARRAVGLGGVPDDLSREADDIRDEAGELGNRQVLA